MSWALLSKWDARFLELARVVSSWSKDPGTRVGAVIADHRHIVSIGYNGFPPHVEDTNERLDNRDTKLSLTIHAEVNAINNANRSVSGCTLYLYPLIPCPDCAKYLGLHRIARVVTLFDPSSGSKYLEMMDLSKRVLNDMEIELDVVAA